MLCACACACVLLWRGLRPCAYEVCRHWPILTHPHSPSLSEPPVLPPSFSHFLPSFLHPSICLSVYSVLSTVTALPSPRPRLKVNSTSTHSVASVEFIYLFPSQVKTTTSHRKREEDHSWHVWHPLSTVSLKTRSHLQANLIELERPGSE